jgi:hypothetical protein
MENNTNVIPAKEGIQARMNLDYHIREYDNSFSRRSSMIDRYRKIQLVFAFLFLLGSLVAPIGWYAEWKDVKPINDYATIITIVGHALQVIGAFGSLVTPDYVEEE